MTTDFRAMCAELIEAMTDDSTSCWQREADVIDRARALLAQQPVSLTCELPEPEGPPAVTISDLLHPGYKLCAELIELCTPVDSIPQLAERLQKLNALADRARALLAQPVAEGPTDEEVTLTYAYAVAAAVGNKRGPFKPEDAEAAQLAGLRAVLSRWGHPTPQPVAKEPMIPSHYRGHEIAVYRDGFHAGYKEALARSANALITPEATND